LEENVELVMEILDPKETKKITEAQFVKNIKKKYKLNELEDVLNFQIIPDDVVMNN
jgi:hypothetical protein